MEVTDVEVLGAIWFSWDHFEHCYVTGVYILGDPRAVSRFQVRAGEPGSPVLT